MIIYLCKNLKWKTNYVILLKIFGNNLELYFLFYESILAHTQAWVPRRLVVARIVCRRWSCFSFVVAHFKYKAPIGDQDVVPSYCKVVQPCKTWSKHRLKIGATGALQLLKISAKWGLPSFISKVGRQWSSVFQVSRFDSSCPSFPMPLL